MYNDSKNIFTGIICFLVIAAVVVGACFALGVFKAPSKTKLPIVYPDKNVNWVQVDDTTLRASFDDKLNINAKQNTIFITAYFNDMDKKFSFDLSQSNLNDALSYEVWSCGGGSGYQVLGFFDDATKTDIDYRIKLVLYNNAALTDAGDVTTGKGFVLEFGGFDKITTDEESGSETYTPVAIEKIKITSIYQEGDLDKLLN